MTLYLARKVGADGQVDETSTTYLARCDSSGCRYVADHADQEVVEDALEGHRVRAHAGTATRTEDATRTGWLSVTGPIAGQGAHEDRPVTWAASTWSGARSDHDAGQGRPTDPPAWTAAGDPHLPPSPTPREGP